MKRMVGGVEFQIRGVNQAKAQMCVTKSTFRELSMACYSLGDCVCVFSEVGGEGGNVHNKR